MVDKKKDNKELTKKKIFSKQNMWGWAWFLVTMIAGIWAIRKVVGCVDCVVDIGWDGDLINWIINTAGKNLYGFITGTHMGIFDGSIFYPHMNVMAYSDMFFVTALWTTPLAYLMGSSGAVSGLALICGQLLTMGVIYWWWKKLSGGSVAAAVGTVAFGLSQIRIHYQVHLQMWGMQYMLFGLFLMYQWIHDKKDWKLFVGAGLLGIQVWESLLPVYFAGGVILCWFVVYGREMFKDIKKLGLVFCLTGVIAMIPLMTYLGVSREFDFKRSIRDAAHNGMSVDELWGRFASPGLYLASTIGGIYMWKKRAKMGKGKDIKWLSLLAGLSLVMALGPVLKLEGKTVKIFGDIFLPLPYSAAYYLIPGFGAFRTPSRWILMWGLAVSGLAAIGVGELLKKGRHFKAVAVLLILAAIIGGTGVEKVRKVSGGSLTPPAYKWLVKQPGEVVLVVPLVDDDLQTEPMMYLLGTDKKLLNGHSGFMPPDRAVFGQRINSGFGTGEIWEEIKNMGVNWVVVDKERFAESGWGENKYKVRYEDERYKVIAVGMM